MQDLIESLRTCLEGKSALVQISSKAKNKEDYHQLMSLYHDARHSAHSMHHERALIQGDHQAAKKHSLKAKFHQAQAHQHYGQAAHLAKRKAVRIGGLQIFAGENSEGGDDVWSEAPPSGKSDADRSGRRNTSDPR